MRAAVAALAAIFAISLPAAAVPISTVYEVTSGTYTVSCRLICGEPQSITTGTITISWDTAPPPGATEYTVTLDGLLPPGTTGILAQYTMWGDASGTFGTNNVFAGGSWHHVGFGFPSQGVLRLYVSTESVVTMDSETLEVFAAPVPEPGTLSIVALGLSALAAFGRVSRSAR